MTSAAPKSQQQPIVFVVDDDVSVRESLELLIKFAGWQPRRLHRQRNFWRVREPRRPTVWCSMFLFRILTVLNCRS